MSLTTIRALFRKDLQDALRNYQVILMVVTPIILSLFFSRVLSGPKDKAMQPFVGILGPADQAFLTLLSPDKLGVRVKFFEDREKLDAAIIESKVSFGIILPTTMPGTSTGTSPLPTLTLIHPSDLPDYAIDRLRETLERELRRFFGVTPLPLPINLNLEPVGGPAGASRSFSGELFPMMILMAMGMIGFLGLPLSFTEEKEKRTLEALFLTPLTISDLILGKSLFSLFLIMGTILIMVLVNGMWQGHLLYFWVMAGLGSLFCVFTGLLIATLAKNQASVNAFGTPVFMVFQLVPNLARSSDTLRYFSNFVPSTYLQSGIKKALFLDLTMVTMRIELGVSLLFTLAMYLLVHAALSRKETVL